MPIGSLHIVAQVRTMLYFFQAGLGDQHVIQVVMIPEVLVQRTWFLDIPIQFSLFRSPVPILKSGTVLHISRGKMLER